VQQTRDVRQPQAGALEHVVVAENLLGRRVGPIAGRVPLMNGSDGKRERNIGECATFILHTTHGEKFPDDYFLGGKIKLDAELAKSAVAK
jgi:hypothetical protein